MKVIYSKDENRKNPLSIKPGGSEVEVTKKGGLVIKYDKIKNVQSYVNSILSSSNDIVLIKCGDKIIYKA
jgi:hypothetical protein